MSVVIPLVAADGTKSTVTLPAPIVVEATKFPLVFPARFPAQLKVVDQR